MNAHDQLNQPPPRQAGQKSIAVVGSGISGLSAAWLLNRRHNVVLYEKENWLGGHSNTVDITERGEPLPVDTGFIVYNEINYPNLTALFEYLGVATKPAPMSFSASLDDGTFEYAGSDLNSLVGQRANIVRPRFWRMLSDTLRFYRDVRHHLETGQTETLSLGEFLDRGGYARPLIDDHILPVCAAIWSATSDQIRDFPFQTFARFFATHGLLDFGRHVRWRTVEGGSRSYVNQLKKSLSGRIRSGVGVRRISRFPDHTSVEDETGNWSRFDEVVIATHSDKALRMLDEPTPQEQALLGAMRYTDNRAVLHTDTNLMPRRERVWASWNYIGSRREDRTQALCVSYWMNRLQTLESAKPLIVTLNPVREPKPETVLAEFDYSHPLFDRTALDAQADLWSLQGRKRTWYCGAYFGYGFHEDGLQSGLAVAEQLGGVRRPWDVPNESGRITLPDAILEAAE